eukprot:6185981-Pleurochrysis_carterae.AAC.1
MDVTSTLGLPTGPEFPVRAGDRNSTTFRHVFATSREPNFRDKSIAYNCVSRTTYACHNDTSFSYDHKPTQPTSAHD